jgi:uncharacterized membrane protein (DUF4010 family)
VRTWINPILTLATLGLLAWLAPVASFDPWNLLSPKKIATMIFALALLQALGSTLAHYLGARVGALLTGFLGGLLSSTATTASLAKRSKLPSGDQDSGELLTFLAATGAMLVEGLALVVAGTSDVHLSNLVVFAGPILATLVLIFVQYRKQTDQVLSSQNTSFSILPILKLSAFIVLILTVSKIFQNLFGDKGLIVVTALVSLFEIHGSIIANVQMQESEGIDALLLSSLLAISIVGSYLSKLFLIATLGSVRLRAGAIKSTLALFVSLAVSWFIAAGL